MFMQRALHTVGVAVQHMIVLYSWSDWSFLLRLACSHGNGTPFPAPVAWTEFMQWNQEDFKPQVDLPAQKAVS